MMIKRFLYLIYYFKELDRSKLKLFMNHVVREKKVNRVSLWWDIILSSLRYNISILEYFQFHFFEKEINRSAYAGTGYMYEYQKLMNPPASRDVLADKLKFLKEYSSFVKHSYVSLRELEENHARGGGLLTKPAGKVVLKSTDGQCGNGIEVISTSSLSTDKLIAELKRTRNDFAEEFVVQHPALMTLSPAGLNTVRIITQLDKEGRVDIIGARLRITVNSAVDNLAAGNLAATIDPKTGIVTGPGVYSDITKKETRFHPITNQPITGFQVPLWQETISMITAAALHNTSNRSIGWDIAITEAGPELIEGNHDWCKLLWQLPAKQGLKHILEPYKHSYEKRK
ncbi:MAG TPA: sugar-transfer associated ATP-grasp domain-containing protein [Chryseosolibacter sp.]